MHKSNHIVFEQNNIRIQLQRLHGKMECCLIQIHSYKPHTPLSVWMTTYTECRYCALTL